jgi:hypothetical protein
LAEFDALLERRIEEQNRAQLNAGIVAAAIVNSNPYREKGARVIDPIEWVPDYKRRKKEAQREQTVEEQIAVLSAVLGCGPGKRAD